MTDLEIRYPTNIDLLPLTTRVSVNIDQNINALRDAILNIEYVLGTDINIGLFTSDPASATVADRLNRIERGIAERNLVFRELNVNDSLQVLLDPNNRSSVRIGKGTSTEISPVTILGPLTILAPAVAKPETLMQTALRVDLTSFNPNLSTASIFKGKANAQEPLITVEDTNLSPDQNSYAFKVIGNMHVSGTLKADYSIEHNKLLNIESVPTESTRGVVKHVTSGDYHTHRKGQYNKDLGKWIVDSSVSNQDYGIINHEDLEGINTLPTQGNDFTPQQGVAYHVTGGDLHDHKNGRGAQIDHGDLSNISPKFSNHVSGGDAHSHTSLGDGGQIDHLDLANIDTIGPEAIHVSGGDLHDHSPGSGVSQISHNSLVEVFTQGANALHVSGGDDHSHDPNLGDGAQIDHQNLSNIGTMTHVELEDKINTFRVIKTGTAQFTQTKFDEIEILHGLGTDQFNVCWSLSAVTTSPPSSAADVGVIFVSNKTSNSFKFKRLGGSVVGPATQAALSTSLAGDNNDIQFIARNPGSSGNNIKIKYIEDSTLATPTQVYTTSSPDSVTIRYKPSETKANDVILAVATSSAASFVNSFVAESNSGDGYISTVSQEDGYLLVDEYLVGGLDSTGFQGLELEWTAIAKN